MSTPSRSSHDSRGLVGEMVSRYQQVRHEARVARWLGLILVSLLIFLAALIAQTWSATAALKEWNHTLLRSMPP
jgi:hypothetical protein